MTVMTINWLAVIAAALSTFILGGLWYSPVLFGKVWMKENHFSSENPPGRSLIRIFIYSFIWALVMSLDLAVYLNDQNTNAVWGAAAGFLAGFGWVAMSIFIIGLFERKSTRYMLINAGYMILSFVLMGLIIGAWR